MLLHSKKKVIKAPAYILCLSRFTPADFFPPLAGRFSGVDKEAEHVMKQRANTMECVSDTIQLAGPPHSKRNGACNL